MPATGAPRLMSSGAVALALLRAFVLRALWFSPGFGAGGQWPFRCWFPPLPTGNPHVMQSFLGFLEPIVHLVCDEDELGTIHSILYTKQTYCQGIMLTKISLWYIIFSSRDKRKEHRK